MSESLRIAVTGATGLLGRHFCAAATAAGHRTWPLSRGKITSNTPTDISNNKGTWDIDSGAIQTPEPADVLIHLAGRNVAARWSAKVKKEIWDSRIPATQKLATHLATVPTPQRPKALILAVGSAIYGDRGDEVLTEDSSITRKGDSFLGDVCLEWEAAAQPARDAGIRVVTLRLGAVLSRDGGALAKMATPVKWGLGGPVGPGTQWLPWIALSDLTGLMLRASADPAVSGTINGAATPVRQHEFMRTLGKVLHRPTIFPLPSFMVKLIFGQMGREVLLSSGRVVSTRLPPGFKLDHPDLESAIRVELNHPK